MAWSFCQTHISGHYRSENLVAEVLDELRRDFYPQLVPAVVHRSQQPFNRDIGVHTFTNTLNGFEQR